MEISRMCLKVYFCEITKKEAVYTLSTALAIYANVMYATYYMYIVCI
jgi:hypothetical protein